MLTDIEKAMHCRGIRAIGREIQVIREAVLALRAARTELLNVYMTLNNDKIGESVFAADRRRILGLRQGALELQETLFRRGENLTLVKKTSEELVAAATKEPLTCADECEHASANLEMDGGGI